MKGTPNINNNHLHFKPTLFQFLKMQMSLKILSISIHSCAAIIAFSSHLKFYQKPKNHNSVTHVQANGYNLLMASHTHVPGSAYGL